jgi:monothiol glutaredoxin
VTLDENVRKQIQALVSRNRVMLFMKGSRAAPQCGFSAKVVQILDELAADYETFDVIGDPAVREGVKEFSSWPTIPQLYVDGRFVGGSDIVSELKEAGELETLLGPAAGQAAAPSITVDEAATRAFQAALAGAEGDFLRFKIDAAFQNDLFLGPRQPGDVEVQTGPLTLLLDRASARRADGVRIGFVEGPEGGFKIDNPNEPPRVRQVTAPELKAMLERGEVSLFDVRPDAERALASIAGARALDAAGTEYLLGLARNTPVAFYCHHGVRSQTAAQRILAEGFKRVYNLKGGIEAWSQSVDSSVPRY